MTERAALAVATALALVSIGAPGRADDIVTDRPGFGESASVVARLRLQVETGMTWARLGRDSSLFDAPQALVRFGLGRALELQAKAPDWVNGGGQGEALSGWSDAAIGLKWHASLGASDVSLRGTIVLPTGDIGLTEERADPEVALAWARALSGPWSLGATLSARRHRAYDTDALSPSVSVGRTLGPHLSAFLEYGGTFAPDARPIHQLDLGGAWLARPDTQIDVSVGFGVSPAAPDFFVAAGVSRRF